ncbi:hypothetical protein SSP35_01_04080 [Streptomyces sp. NBRC 110611]|uniref:hypothetical protein n=1 Tax=Streptomyces sp. NBRC 110611 TaxID=1621259 RepID=UPI000829D21B|nr:hypothetical protein [Streptomyces sp. NBRC 110611]GAU65071.1 hypothetical protein SSP35_01_04080 [Streptomyces sp. NBRC 110611]
MGKSARSLLSTVEFEAVRTTIKTNNPGMHDDTADGILWDALAFVATCAQFPKARLVPSRAVDEGWHALILNTEIYAALCDRLGAFIHHRPEEPDPTRFNPTTIIRTTALIEEAGYSVDVDLWGQPDDALISVAASCQHSDDRGPIVPIPKPKG